MTRNLQKHQSGPFSGKLGSVVVLLHGYGADGADLVGLNTVLGPVMPDTLFVAPDAPEPCPANPAGRQWFPIPWLDGSTEEESLSGLLASAHDLDLFLDEIMAAEGVAASQMFLLGFSQGTMVALHVALRRAKAVAGVVGFSGRLLLPKSLARELKSKPPILLLHGDQDEVVPPESMALAARHLADAGIDVESRFMKDTAHSISPDGLSFASRFMRDKLSQ